MDYRTYIIKALLTFFFFEMVVFLFILGWSNFALTTMHLFQKSKGILLISYISQLQVYFLLDDGMIFKQAGKDACILTYEFRISVIPEYWVT